LKACALATKEIKNLAYFKRKYVQRKIEHGRIIDNIEILSLSFFHSNYLENRF
jgi:hypothetical protein